MTRLLSATMVVLALLGTGTAVLLATESGTRWSLQRLEGWLPALQLRGVSGTWTRGIDVDAASWTDPAMRLHGQTLRLRLSLRALITGTVRIDRLSAQHLSVNYRQGDAGAEAKPVHLPSVFLPFTLSLRHFRVHTLSLGEGSDKATLTDIELRVQLAGNSLVVNRASLAWADGRLSAAGRLKLTDGYPLDARADLDQSSLPGRLSARLDGSLETLDATLFLAGRWPLRGRATLSPLQPGIPLTAEIRTRGSVTVADSTGPLRVDSGTLTASGSLNALSGSLRLQLNEPRYGDSRFAGRLDWKGGVLRLRDARWGLPDAEPILRASCSLTPATANWQCEGSVDRLPLKPLLQAREGSLSTTVQAEGRFRDGLSLAVALPNIRGTLGSAAITGDARLGTGDGREWQVQQLQLAVGKNTVRAGGAVGGDAELTLRATLDNLAQLHPQLAGSAQLDARLHGPLATADLRATLAAQNLAAGSWQIAKLNGHLEAPQLARAHSNLQLAVAGVGKKGSERVFAGGLSARGDRENLQWRLHATDNADAALSINCQSRVAADASSARLSCADLDGRAAMRGGPIDLQLADTATLEWQRGKAVTIQPFCVRADKARACLEQRTALPPTPEAPLRIIVSEVPVEWLAAYAPSRIDLLPGAKLSGDMQISRLQPPVATARLAIPRVAWRWPQGEEEATATLESIDAELGIDGQEASLKLGARSDTIGALSFAAQVREPMGDRLLSGRLQIHRLSTGAFDWAYPAEYHLDGELNAELTLAGTLTKPDVSGRLSLSDATATTPGLEDPLRELQLQATLAERDLQFQGRFRLGDGTGRLTGQLQIPEQWQQWQLNGELHTSAVSLAPLPESNITVSSALTLQADAETVRLDGDIQVDRAEIHIRELPPETQRVSSDAEIVGDQPGDGPGTYLDIRLALGEKFHFTGFGADVYLTGGLRVRQNPTSILTAQGEVRVARGRYRAYGQRLVVRNGSFLFDGPPDNPNLNLQAIREMPPGSDLVVGVDVAGTLRNPLATLFSEPPMPETEQAYYLLTGKPPPEYGQATQLSAESALLSIGVAGASERAAKVAERIGISDFRISAASTETGTQTQVSGYLSPRLYVRYGSGLQQGANTVTFQYRLTRKLVLEAVTGVEQALDALYSFSID